MITVQCSDQVVELESGSRFVLMTWDLRKCSKFLCNATVFKKKLERKTSVRTRKPP